ncbi:efflux transporter outer membrane subunit [Formicincola oecophyllae]|uniref:Efflux transporter outer membrane subunit n=1 Tax=Formicincola oecophyllae TaxID=2558361 RepID=A0A4Y6UD37_9PROT|nr:efflux transporter outer membrane subunit [Formicincola oecophyllae]QDH14015.1 efflux transporter outer membrane subunit [Formicincola oecophyllae]
MAGTDARTPQKPRRLGRALGALASLAAALAGCAVGPDFSQPQAPAPAHFHRNVPEGPKRVTEGAFNPQWWRIYNDPALTALEGQVADGNLDLRIASARFAQSQAERRIAGAIQFPAVAGNASYMRERGSPNGVLGLLGTGASDDPATIADGAPGFGPAKMAGSKGDPPFNLPQYGLGASWEVDLWGHVRRQVESADAGVVASAYQRRGLLVSLMAQAALDYIALRTVQNEAAILERNITIATRSVGLTRLRFSAGTATRGDVAEAAGQLSAFEARLPPLQAQEAHLLNALSYLTGQRPGAVEARLGKRAPVPEVPGAVPAGLPSELVERRPDIQAAAARLHAATANVGVALAEFFPRVTLSGSMDIQALHFSGLGSWASRQYGFGPTLSLPLFQGGRLIGQLRLRRKQEQEAALRFQDTVLGAWREVADAMADFASAQRQRQRLQAAVRDNQEAVRIAQLQYAEGSGDFLNVLTLQNALLTSHETLVRAHADVASAVARLYQALGGGWETRYPLEAEGGHAGKRAEKPAGKPAPMP